MKKRLIFVLSFWSVFFSIGLFSQTTTDYVNFGLKEAQVQDYDSAIADYNHAIEINPKFTQAYINRSLAKFNKKDFDGAIADYSHALEIGPKSAYLYDLLGNAKYNKFDFDGAIADYNHALEIDPKYAYAYNGRGLAESEKGGRGGTGSAILLYFYIFEVLLFAYLIFAPAGKPGIQKSRFYRRAFIAELKSEPQWFVIAARVLLALGIISMLFGIVEYDLKNLQMRQYFHRYYLMFGNAFVGVFVFMCFAYREKRKCKKAAMAKMNLATNP